MEKENPSRNNLLRITGAVVALFSIIVGSLVMFALPGGCSFVTSFVLVILFFLFIAGGTTFLIGQLLSWRERKLKPAGPQ